MSCVLLTAHANIAIISSTYVHNCVPFAISGSVTLQGPQAGTRLKQVEAELTEEFVFPTFSLYFVNKRGWSEMNEDSGIKI